MPTEAQIAEFNHKLTGAHLPFDTLKELLQSEKLLLLHFLRHLGCIFCKQSVTDLHTLVEANPGFPSIYFVHQSPMQQANEFFDTYFPEARHISDPSLSMYKLFGIKKMPGTQFLNPALWLKGIQATLSGHRQNEVMGNADILSGTFLFNNGLIVWQHLAEYAGDDPSWSRFALTPRRA